MKCINCGENPSRASLVCSVCSKILSKISQLERERIKRDYVLNLKKEPCMDCGNCYPSLAMDFDHVRGKKETLSELIGRNCSLNVVKEEIKKCDLVCSNCHRERTYERMQEL